MVAPSTVGSLDIGKYLKIVSKGAVYNNLSEDSPMWDQIKKKKKGPDEGRELKYLLRSAYGSSAARFVPVRGGAYPKGKKSVLNEGTTQYKDFALTVEVERSAIVRAISDFSRYGEPLAEELRAKTIALSRQLSMSLYKDGTGVIGTSNGASTALAAQETTITLDQSDTARGFIAWFEQGDFVVAFSPDGVSVPPSTAGGHDHYEVMSIDRVNATAVLRSRDINNANSAASGASDIIAGTLFYRGTLADIATGAQSAPSDLNPSPTADYNSLSDEWVGLAGFCALGPLVNGITQVGTLAATRRDALGNPIDSQDFQQVMSQLMIAAGRNRYKYNKAMMSWECNDALIESRETDRRFNSSTDNVRGTSELFYQHGKNKIVFEPDEFVPQKKIYIVPEGDVLQFYGSDFETVKPDGGKGLHLKPNASGYDRTMQMFMEGHGALMSVHNQAIGLIRNFTV